MKKKTSLTKENDRSTQYAESVVSGEISAGPIVRASCRRHLDDLTTAKDRGYYFDKSEAAKSIRFFENELFLNGGQFEGLPFLLLPWQCFVIGSLFGWKRKSDHTRRFRVAYIETPKGSGKSPLCAGIGIKGLCADQEPRAEIYAAATFRDQAMVLFRDAVAFYDQSQKLQSILGVSGTGSMRWNLFYLSKGSFFRVISSEKKGQSGPRPHMVLLDEIHEHKDGTVIEMLRAGFKFRRQPLQVMITNSGHDKTSVCWEYHEMAEKIAFGAIQNDEFFSYICSYDEDDLIDDKYLADESLWSKVNPSLEAGIPGYDYIRGQVTEAQGMPSKMATVKRLCFCQWTEALNPWIGADVWLQCKDVDFDNTMLGNGRRCWGGLDLSRVNDLTALALVFEPVDSDPVWRLMAYFWIPGVNLRRKSDQDHVPYDVWKDQEWIECPPVKTIKKSYVVKRIQQIHSDYNLQGIAYDRAMVNDLFSAADDAGVTLIHGKWDKEKKIWDFGYQEGIKIMPFGQEPRSMHPAIEKFEGWLQNKEIMHDGNPVMTWCMSNAVIKEVDDYRRLSKNLSIGRIDGAQAAVMACGVAEANKPEQESIYATRGVFFID
jgi:phage terminase large subunit-like protein